jgi:hypothetical protein
MMNISDMTRKQFDELPWREGWGKEIMCDSIVILPTRHKHESGFRCMDFVAVKENEPICRLSGCSDVIHIDGIGGYGYQWYERTGAVPKAIQPAGWSIDCLPKSGLLRLWSRNGVICGAPLSSFEIFADPRPQPTEKGE